MRITVDFRSKLLRYKPSLLRLLIDDLNKKLVDLGSHNFEIWRITKSQILLVNCLYIILMSLLLRSDEDDLYDNLILAQIVMKHHYS